MLYFQDPWWIAVTSLLHAPLIILLLGYVGHRRRDRRAGARLYWFALGCGLHSLIDILTHRDDGPVLLFPFEWSYRIPAPISYWDPRYGGRIFAPIELAVDLVLIGYFAALGARALYRRLRRPQVSRGTA